MRTYASGVREGKSVGRGRFLSGPVSNNEISYVMISKPFISHINSCLYMHNTQTLYQTSIHLLNMHHVFSDLWWAMIIWCYHGHWTDAWGDSCKETVSQEQGLIRAGEYGLIYRQGKPSVKRQFHKSKVWNRQGRHLWRDSSTRERSENRQGRHL